MKKKEEKLRALQLTLEKLEKTSQVTKFEEERKIKLDNGLFLDIKKIKDRRWIEDFNSKYVSGLAAFKALNPNKTAHDFINCEIEKINKRVAEIKRIWSLSEDEYYNELSKDKENIDYKKFYLNEYKDSTEKEIKGIVLRSKPRTEPNEFEDYRIKLYEQKLDELPKTKSTADKRQRTNINQCSKIFSNYGFELFNYILENHIKPKGKRGRYADLSFYYWEMFNSEEKYIHQRPEVFKKWFCQEYDDSFEKIKTINEVNDTNGNRKKHYQTSLDWFKTQI